MKAFIKIYSTIKISSFIFCSLLFFSSCDIPSSSAPKTEVEKKFDSVNVYTKNGNTMPFVKFIDSIKSNKPIVVITTYDFCGGCKGTIEDLIAEKEKSQKFEVVAFFIESINPKGNGYTKNQNRFEKFVEKYNYNCPIIFDPTGSYTKHVLKGKGSTPQTNIILNDSIVFFSRGEYVKYWDETQLILDALHSQEKPITNTINYSDDKNIQLSYTLRNFKKEGQWTNYYENNTVQSVGNYINDKKEGEWKGYHKNGQLSYKGFYKKGKLDGEFKNHYENGQLKTMYHAKDGKLFGEFKSFFENGKISQLQNYIEGKAHGEFKKYYESSQIKEIYTYSNGKADGMFKDFYENGQLNRVYSNINGEASGEFKAYYDSGELKVTRNYKNGKAQGAYKNYFKNGKLLETGNYVNDKQEGEWKTYFDNGQINYLGEYVNGKAEGEWTEYWKNGQLFQLRNWKKGKLIDIYSCFDKNGKPLNKGTLANGNGTRHYFDQSGKITSTDNYINGEKEKGYQERIANEKLFARIKKTKAKKLRPVKDNNKLILDDFKIRNYAMSYKDEMAVCIPFDVPLQGEINFLLLNNSFSIQVFSNSLENHLITRSYNFKTFYAYKKHSLILDGSKINKKDNGKYFSYKSFGSPNLEMDKLRGNTCYLVFTMSKKAYQKNKNDYINIGYYKVNSEKEIEEFNQILKDLEKNKAS